MPENFYTTTLFRSGNQKISEKVTEESQELIEAFLKSEEKSDIIHEAADLFYHIFVLLTAAGVSLEEIAVELKKRFGTSGLLEKAARPEQSK